LKQSPFLITLVISWPQNSGLSNRTPFVENMRIFLPEKGTQKVSAIYASVVVSHAAAVTLPPLADAIVWLERYATWSQKRLAAKVIPF
jgi:hypothetical protein